MVIGERLRVAFKNAGIPLAQVAEHIGISQTSLYTILKKDSFELEYLKKSAELLGVSASSFLDDSATQSKATVATQTGDFNQAGNSNSQKIKVSKAPAQELAMQLDSCLREVDHLKEKLVYANQTIASKDETISLLRGSYSRPN